MSTMARSHRPWWLGLLGPVALVVLAGSAAYACNPAGHAYLSDTSLGVSCYTTPGPASIYVPVVNSTVPVPSTVVALITSTSPIWPNLTCVNDPHTPNPGAATNVNGVVNLVGVKGGCDANVSCSGSGNVWLDPDTYAPKPEVPGSGDGPNAIKSKVLKETYWAAAPAVPNPALAGSGNEYSQSTQTGCDGTGNDIQVAGSSIVGSTPMSKPTSTAEGTGVMAIPTTAPAGLHKICADYGFSQMWDLIVIG